MSALADQRRDAIPRIRRRLSKRGWRPDQWSGRSRGELWWSAGGFSRVWLRRRSVLVQQLRESGWEAVGEAVDLLAFDVALSDGQSPVQAVGVWVPRLVEVGDRH